MVYSHRNKGFHAIYKALVLGIFSRFDNLEKCFFFCSLILYLQDGEEVVYDMDIEILDSYPTIEILGSLHTQVPRSRKLINLQYSALTQYSTIGILCTQCDTFHKRRYVQ